MTTPITDWQTIPIEEFIPGDKVVHASICADIEAKLIAATEALEIYANQYNWSINGICNPNNHSFDGLTPAKTALKQIKELENYLPSKTA